MPARQACPCVLCRQTVETNEAAITITMMVRTVGIADAPKSESGQLYMCVDCATALALGRVPPPSQPLTLMAHQLISLMTGKDPAIILAAWHELRRTLDLPPANVRMVPALTEGEIIPPPRRALQPAS